MTASFPVAYRVKPPTAIIASSTVMSARKGSDRGWEASPTILTCSGIGPTKASTMTVTSGSLIYCASRCSYSRARAVGVFPIATTSSTSGIETRPSGRTGTVTVNSGLRHTKMLRLSPGPMRYSADGSDEAGGAGGSSGVPPHPAMTSTATAATAPDNVRCTFCFRSALSDPDEYWYRRMLTTKIIVPDHRFAASIAPFADCAIAPNHLFCNVDVARQFAVDYDLNVKFTRIPCVSLGLVQSRRTCRSGKKRKKSSPSLKRFYCERMNKDRRRGPRRPPLDGEVPKPLSVRALLAKLSVTEQRHREPRRNK
jgi:hypothetical protein